jgi:glutamyl-tRNA synthetase
VTDGNSSDAIVLGELAPKDVRVRFCPSPTGNPHVGLVRSALYNWAFARHFGGTFVFRIEDTDASRDSEESYEALLASLRWLGLDWDEGPEAGGEHGPYRQSERYDIYRDVTAKLLESGKAYHCYCTTAELEERREAARAAGKPSGYDGHCRNLTGEQLAAYQAEDREPVVRMRTPDETVTFTDLIRGEISVDQHNLFDYVLVRANGHPLYTLVNPVDDALMGITHVLRGEDLLSSTPRQLVMHEALRDLGIASGPMPRFAHLPLVTGDGGRKLSKREPESSLQLYLDRGFLPEGLLNYLALLGWSIGDDEEVFSMAEMAAAFDVTRVNPNAARFDLKKAEAINGDHVRMLELGEFARRVVPYLQSAGVVSTPLSPGEEATLAEAAPLPANITMVEGDGTKLCFKDKTFDIVFSNSVIEHVGRRHAGEHYRMVAHRGQQHCEVRLDSWSRKLSGQELVAQPLAVLEVPARWIPPRHDIVPDHDREFHGPRGSFGRPTA